MNGNLIRLVLKAACMTVLVGLSYIVPVRPGSADSTPIPMPNIRLSDGSGLPFPLARYLGNVLVVEFWSISCGPCLKELTFLDRLQGDFPGKPLMVLAVSEDNLPMAGIRAALARQKLTYLKPFADPGGTAAQSLNVRGLPTSFVIDRHGLVVMQLEGPQQWDRPDYEQRFAYLMGQPFP